MLSLFQDASGNWHWPSVVTGAGWLLSTLVIFVGLYIGMIERDKAGPWRLTTAEIERFTGYLKSTPSGKVAIEYTSADQVRSNAFASVLAKMVTDGGYDLWGYMPVFQQTGNVAPLIGIQIGVTSDSAPTGQHLQEAFRLAGIKARIARGGDYGADRATIYVGIKPTN